MDQLLDDGPAEALDDHELKRILQHLDQAIRINSELRMKYLDQPERFVDSEIELDEAVRSLMKICDSPELYSVLAVSPALPNIIQLLQHNNIDIAMEVVRFFENLVEVEEVNDAKLILILYDALIKGFLIENLVELIKKCPEANHAESTLVYSCMGIIEVMMDVRPKLAKYISEQTTFISYLVRRIEDESQPLDDNRNYAAELLVQLVTECEEARQVVGRCGGIENLLIVLSRYRKSDPRSAEEIELVMNIFDALTLILLAEENQDHFFNLEGLQLMMKLVQAKNSLSVKAYLLIGIAIMDKKKSCGTLVDIGGLSIVYPILMRKGLKSANGEQQKKLDEATVGIIKQLLKNTEGPIKQRVIEKTKEKMAALLELRQEYIDKIPLIDPEEYD